MADAAASRFHLASSAPSPKHTRHTVRLWFARSPTTWRSIPATIPSPASREKTAGRKSFPDHRGLTLKVATPCVRQPLYHIHVTEKRIPRVHHGRRPASLSVRGR